MGSFGIYASTRRLIMNSSTGNLILIIFSIIIISYGSGLTLKTNDNSSSSIIGPQGPIGPTGPSGSTGTNTILNGLLNQWIPPSNFTFKIFSTNNNWNNNGGYITSSTESDLSLYGEGNTFKYDPVNKRLTAIDVSSSINNTFTWQVDTNCRDINFPYTGITMNKCTDPNIDHKKLSYAILQPNDPTNLQQDVIIYSLGLNDKSQNYNSQRFAIYNPHCGTFIVSSDNTTSEGCAYFLQSSGTKNSGFGDIFSWTFIESV
jgi:hypothetical protein